MALVDMQHLSVLVMKKDRNRLVRLVQQAGCVQFKPAVEGDPALEAPASPAEDEALNRIKWAIARLSKYDPVKPSMFKPLPKAEVSQLETEDLSNELLVVEQVEQLERRSGELRGAQTRLHQASEQLKPWLALDVPREAMKGTASTRVFTGLVPTRALADLQTAWQGRPAVITALGSQRESTAFFAVVHQSEADKFQDSLREAGFQHAAPPQGKGTPMAQQAQIELDLKALDSENDNITKQFQALAEHLPALRLAFETLTAQKARQEAMGTMAHTQSVSLMSGWVPKEAAQPLAQAIKQEFPGAQVQVREPLEGEDPPVLLRNSAIASPYEAVVSGFALPANGALDPTSVMMPFFAIFFGMMVSDAGYGIMMALLIPIMIKIMKPSAGARKIFWILAGGGLSTILWGALYNTWFGFGPWPSVFDPVNNSLPVMAVCIGIGALHLFAGLILGMVQSIRKGDYLSAIYDKLSWMLLVIGLGLLLLPQTAAIGKWLAIIGAGIVLLTAGRDKSKNPIKRLVSGLGALYGVTGWISDLLSYMRLFGMGLATGVIGMVINQLVGMIMGGGIIGMAIGAVIFVGAHLFNAAINILGAYVHACRLQYIEFFGKFYEEGGKPFKPLRFAPRYVRLHD